jgi:hypothetical protein
MIQLQLPNTFERLQGITAAAGTRFNRNQNELLNTKIFDQPIITNENNINLTHNPFVNTGKPTHNLHIKQTKTERQNKNKTSLDNPKQETMVQAKQKLTIKHTTKT